MNALLTSNGQAEIKFPIYPQTITPVIVDGRIIALNYKKSTTVRNGIISKKVAVLWKEILSSMPHALRISHLENNKQTTKVVL